MNKSSYQEMYDIQNEHWWFIGRRKFIKKILNQYLSQPPEKILEIGSGAGGNIPLLSTYGELEITDIEEKAILFCRQIAEENGINLKSIHGDFQEKYSRDSKKTFSAICMFDVIEHIKEERQILNLCSDLLTEKGKIFITVPAYQWLWSVHDDYFHHERRYTKKSLQKILNESEFKILDCGYFNSLLFPVAVIQRLLEKLVGAGRGNVTLPNKLINQILMRIFSLESKLYKFSRFSFGLSIWMVAEKK